MQGKKYSIALVGFGLPRQQLVKALLAGARYSCRVFEYDAIPPHAEEPAPALVVACLQPAGAQAWELCRRLRECRMPDWSQVPVLLVSEAEVTDELRRKALAAGSVALIGDGDNLEGLLNAIQGALADDSFWADQSPVQKAIVETMPLGVVIQLADGRIEYANPAALEILGLSLEEMTGRTSVDPRWRTVHEDGSPFPGEEHPASVCLSSGKPVRDVVMGVQNPRRDRIAWIRVHGIPLFRDGEARPSRVYTTFEDITERKEAEEALRRSEERYHRFFENAPIALREVDVSAVKAELDRLREQGVRDFDRYFAEHPDEVRSARSLIRHVMTNRRCLELYGFHEMQERGQPLPVFSTDESWVFFAKMLAALAAGRLYLEAESVVQDARGTRHVVVVRMFVDPEHAVTLKRVYLGFMDVSSLKAAEAGVRASRARLAMTIRNARVGTWDWHVPSDRVDINDRWAGMLGYTVEELAPANFETWRRLSHPEDLERAVAALRRHWSGEADWYECEVRMRHKTGHWVWVLTRGAVSEWAAGRQPVRMMGTHDDISRLKAVEEQLRQSEADLNEAQALAHIGSFEHDFVTGKLHWSKELHRLTGVEEPDLSAINLLVVPEDREPLKQWKAALWAGRCEPPIEHRIRLSDGTERALLLRSKAVRNASGEVMRIFGTVEDITARKREEAERSLLEEELRQAQKMESIGRLAGGVAHDFNNLITVILGHCDLMLMRTQEGGPLRRSVDTITQAAERAADLTRQLLAFSRKQIVQPRQLDLNGIVADMEEMLRRVIGEDIELQTQLGPHLRQVKVDPGQIHQVLMNLTSNARDAIPGQGTILVETLNAHPGAAGTLGAPEMLARHGVILRVTDSGMGMNEEVRQRLFEPFFTTKELGRGTGLGLSTVYGIVQQAGGWIGVESQEGQGSAFTLILPPAGAGETAATPSWTEEHNPVGGATILLVEDEANLRSLVKELLTARGCKVLEACSGAEALRMAEAHADDLDLLLTDVVLPQMSGREVARRLEVTRPGLQVLYMSGYPQDEIARRGVLEEGLEYLAKPFKAEELLRRVSASLRRNAARSPA